MLRKEDKRFVDKYFDRVANKINNLRLTKNYYVSTELDGFNVYLRRLDDEDVRIYRMYPIPSGGVVVDHVTDIDERYYTKKSFSRASDVGENADVSLEYALLVAEEHDDSELEEFIMQDFSETPEDKKLYNVFSEVVEEAEKKEQQDEKGEDVTMKNNIFERAGKTLKGITGISMLDGSIAYKLNGAWIAINANGQATDVTNFVMELDVPSVTMPAEINTVQRGDLLMVDGGLVLVNETTPNGVEVTDGSGQSTKLLPVVNQMYGGAMVLKVFNPMLNGGIFGQAGANVNGIASNPMAMMALMSGGENGSTDSMTKMMLMSQMMSGNAQGGVFGQAPINEQQPQMHQQPYAFQQQATQPVQPQAQPMPPQQQAPMTYTQTPAPQAHQQATNEVNTHEVGETKQQQ